MVVERVRHANGKPIYYSLAGEGRGVGEIITLIRNGIIVGVEFREFAPEYLERDST